MHRIGLKEILGYWDINKDNRREGIGELHREFMREMKLFTINPTANNVAHITVSIPINLATLAPNTAS